MFFMRQAFFFVWACTSKLKINVQDAKCFLKNNMYFCFSNKIIGLIK